MKTHDHNGDAAHKAAMFAHRQQQLALHRQIEAKAAEAQATEASDGIVCPRCKRVGGRIRKERKNEIRLVCVICNFLWRRKKPE